MINDESSTKPLQQQVLRLVLILLWLLLGFVVIKIGLQIQEIVFSFLVAILINYILLRPVNFLTRYVRSRMAAVMLIFLFAITLISTLVYFAYPNIVEQFLILRNSLPNLVSEIYQFLVNLNLFLLKNFQFEIPLTQLRQEDLLNLLISFVTRVNVTDFGITVITFVTGSVNLLLYIVLTLIMSFYILVDGERAWNLFLVPFSDKLVRHFQAIRAKVNLSLNAFILGQLQIASLTSLFMLIVYLILGVPFAVLFSAIQMLEIFPVLGTWVAIVPCVLIICLTSGLSKGIAVFVLYLLYTQFARDNFIAPRIMGDALGLHPLGIIVALIIGAKISGIAGIVFALPVLASINAIIDYNVELSRLKITKPADYWETL